MPPLYRCHYNSHLTCPIKKGRCPLKDRRFDNNIERWLLCGRTPRSIDFRTDFTPGKINPNNVQNTLNRLAETALLFDDMDPVAKFYELGGMTYKLCRIIRRGYWRWRKHLMPV